MGWISKAKYEGNTLSVYTTHIKEGHIRANGMNQSSEAEVSEHFIRHGDRITYFSVIYDPVNLDEPFPRTISIFNVPNDPNSWTMPCDDAESPVICRKITSLTTTGSTPVPS